MLIHSLLVSLPFIHVDECICRSVLFTAGHAPSLLITVGSEPGRGKDGKSLQGISTHRGRGGPRTQAGCERGAGWGGAGAESGHESPSVLVAVGASAVQEARNTQENI